MEAYLKHVQSELAEYLAQLKDEAHQEEGEVELRNLPHEVARMLAHPKVIMQTSATPECQAHMAKITRGTKVQGYYPAARDHEGHEGKDDDQSSHEHHLGKVVESVIMGQKLHAACDKRPSRARDAEFQQSIKTTWEEREQRISLAPIVRAPLRKQEKRVHSKVEELPTMTAATVRLLIAMLKE